MKVILVNGFHWLNRPIPASSRLWRYGLVLILGIFLLTTVVESLTVPVFEGNDEQRHYAYVRYLLDHHTLPPRIPADDGRFYLYTVGQEAGQPPLYYIPVALLTAWVTHADEVAPYVVHNPFAAFNDNIGLPHDNHDFYLHGSEGAFPFQGVALADHLGRLVSAVMGVFTLLGVYCIARALTPSRPAIALLAVALVSSVPGFIFLHSVMTNDVAVILFVTLSLWVAVRIICDGPNLRLAILGGLFAALAVLSKINGVWAGGIVWLALLASALVRHRERPFRSVLPRILFSLGIWTLVVGWWFAFGIVQAGDPLGITIHAANANQSPLSFTQPDLSLTDNLTMWDSTTWYASGWSMIFGPDWIYQTFRYLYLAGLLGLAGLCLLTLIKLRSTRRDMRVHMLQATCLAIAIVLAIIGGLYWQLVYTWRFGRLLYPGLTAAAVLAAIGWAWWLDQLPRIRLPHATYWFCGVVVAFLLQRAAVYSAVDTVTALLPHEMAPPTTPGIIPTRVTFLDPEDHKTPVAAVTGYRVGAQDLRVGNALYADICWKSLGYTKDSFPYSLQLVGPNDVRPGTRNSYHGLGSYPLDTWKPGEEFCDLTSVYVAFTIDQPRAYNLVVTLFQTQPASSTTSLPLPAVDGAGRMVYPVIGRVRVAPDHMPLVTPTVSLGDTAGLVSSDIQLQPDNVLSMTLRWLALAPTSVSEKVFVHVVDDDTGKVIAQSDHEPDAGWFPTNYWQKDDVIDDQFGITLPAGIDLTQVALQLGMYDPQTGVRLAAVDLATRGRFRDDAVPVQY